MSFDAKLIVTSFKNSYFAFKPLDLNDPRIPIYLPIYSLNCLEFCR